MANQISGRLIEIGQTVSVPTKNGGAPLTKREFLLDATPFDPYTGELSEHKNILPFDLTGDKCAELDRYGIGEVITVYFVIRGREWTNQDGLMKRMISVNCYKIEPRQRAQQPVMNPAAQPIMQPVATPTVQAMRQPVPPPAQPAAPQWPQQTQYSQSPQSPQQGALWDGQQPFYPQGSPADQCPF